MATRNCQPYHQSPLQVVPPVPLQARWKEREQCLDTAAEASAQRARKVTPTRTGTAGAAILGRIRPSEPTVTRDMSIPLTSGTYKREREDTLGRHEGNTKPPNTPIPQKPKPPKK